MFLDDSIKSHCCGCKVCATVCKKEAITFSFDDEGFWYPKIDSEKCVNCGLCRKVCPIKEDSLSPLIEKNQVYAAFSNDSAVLENSTSGGVFTHISDYFLENGGVVFGHKYDEKLRSVCVMAQNKDERTLFRGSKYVQSDMGKIYTKIKEQTDLKRAVLVTGTPCQIDAVKNFFNQKVPENLYFLEIICHGVPSPGIFAEYLELLENKNGKKITNFEFRKKDKGWLTPLRKISYNDGTSCGELLNADAFNNLFQGTDCILRPSCYECRYAGKERVADISTADFWGIDREDNEMFNENRGTSLVLVNTEKGRRLFEYACRFMTVKNMPLCVAAKRNLPLHGLPVPHIPREEFFDFYQKNGLKKSMKKFCFPYERSFKGRIVRIVRKTLGEKGVKMFVSLKRKLKGGMC